MKIYVSRKIKHSNEWTDKENIISNIGPILLGDIKKTINEDYKDFDGKTYTVNEGVAPVVSSTEEHLIITFECIEGKIEKPYMINMVTQQGPNLNS